MQQTHQKKMMIKKRRKKRKKRKKMMKMMMIGEADLCAVSIESEVDDRREVYHIHHDAVEHDEVNLGQRVNEWIQPMVNQR